MPLRRGTLILEESNCKLLGGTVACFAATPLSSLNDHRLNNKSPKRGEETEEQKEDLVPMDIDVGNDFNEHYDQRESPFKMPEKNWTEKSNNAHDSVSQLLISPIQPSLASGHIDLSLSSTEARVFESPVHQDNGCNCSKSSSDLASNEHTAYSLSLSYHHNMQQNSSRVTFIRGFAGKLYRFKLAKDSSKKYFFDVIVEFDDGFTSVAAIVSPSLCEKFLGIKAEEFKKSLSLSTDVTQETKKLMLNFQTLHGVFEARTLTSSEKLTAKNNASIQLEAILESGGIANVVTTFFKHSVVNYK